MRGTYSTSAAALVALALGIAGCSPAPTPSPAPSATLIAQPSAASSPSAPAPATSAPSPSAPLASPGPAAVDAWTWTSLDGSVFGTQAPDLAVALPDGRTLAFTNPESDETMSPVLWTSADGLAWERVPDPRPFRPRASDCWVSIADLERTADGLVAVGLQSCESTGRATGLAWTSPDGLVWAAASVAHASGGSIEEVVPTATGLVGLGRTGVEVPDGEGWQDRSRPAEWTSADGRSWRLVKHPDHTPVRRVVAFDGAYYGLAWFEDRLNARGDIVEDRRTGVYSSRNAVRWRQVAGAPVAAVLAPSAGLLVAVGATPAPPWNEPMAWASADGAAWAGGRLPDPALPPGAVSPDDDPSLVDVRADSLVALPGGGLLALGSRDANSGSTAVAWASPDGRSWSALPLPFGPHFLLGAALPVGAGRVLLQGIYQEDDGSNTDTVVVGATGGGTPPSATARGAQNRIRRRAFSR